MLRPADPTFWRVTITASVCALIWLAVTKLVEISMSNNIIFYSTPSGNRKIEVLHHDEMFWLTQKQIAELFGVGKAAVSKHLKNIFAQRELFENRTVSKMETVRSEGNREVKRNVEHYNLDAIIGEYAVDVANRQDEAPGQNSIRRRRSRIIDRH